MIDFGDGREERLDALMLEIELRADPAVKKRRDAYEAAVSGARAEAKAMGNAAAIEKLIEGNPAYIRSLLETEDERFGPGSLAERYARTFWKSHQTPTIKEDGK
jgi:hypothetical protein